MIADRFDAMTTPEPNTGCLLWTGGVTSIGGYGKFTRDGNKGTVLAHRFAWECANGPIPKGLVVRHLKCNQPSCVNHRHLAIGTPADNSADMTQQGRQARGEKINTNKLTAAQVLAIRGAWDIGAATQTKLAAMFGVNQAHVSSIVHRKSWQHL